MFRQLLAFQTEYLYDDPKVQELSLLDGEDALTTTYLDYLETFGQRFHMDNLMSTAYAALSVLEDHGRGADVEAEVTKLAAGRLGVSVEGFSLKDLYIKLRDFILDLIKKVRAYIKAMFNVTAAVEKKFDIIYGTKIIGLVHSGGAIDNISFDKTKLEIWPRAHILSADPVHPGIVNRFGMLFPAINTNPDKSVIAAHHVTIDTFRRANITPGGIFVLGTKDNALLTQLGWTPEAVGRFADMLRDSVRSVMIGFSRLDDQYAEDLKKAAKVYDDIAKGDSVAKRITQKQADATREAGVLMKSVFMTAFSTYRELMHGCIKLMDAIKPA